MIDSSTKLQDLSHIVLLKGVHHCTKTYTSPSHLATSVEKMWISLPQEAIFKVTGAENSRSEIMQRQDYVNLD